MWTATQPARFLDLVANDALYAIGRLIAPRGLRRDDGGSASGVHPGIQSRSPTLHFAVASGVTGLPDLESIDEVPAADESAWCLRRCVRQLPNCRGIGGADTVIGPARSAT